MPRPSYERGHHSRPKKVKHQKNCFRSRGLSMDQVCVPCAITPDRLTVAKVCKLGSASSDGLVKVFKKHIEKGSLIITDEYKAYGKFSKIMNILLVQTNPNHPNSDYNIQQVDSLHSQMKRMFNHRFCGVATKYLNNYVEMIRINLNAQKSRENKLNTILQLLLGFISYSRKDIYQKDYMPVLC